jgi:metal transporter CNNM
LTLVNPNESMPLKSVLDKKKRTLIFTHKEEKLPMLLNCMKQGRSHLAIVKLSNDNGSPAIGVVTLEDIIEEILQTEIADETDIQGTF